MPLVIKFSKNTKGREHSVKRPLLLVNIHTSPICSFLDLVQPFLYLWVREACVVCARVVMSTPSPPVTHGSGGPPMPGRTGTAVRVDQAGAGPFHPWTQDDVSKFFDPTRYRGRMVQPQMPRGTLGGEMHTTRANILKFFDTEQYHNSGVVSQSQTGVPLVSNEQHATQKEMWKRFSALQPIRNVVLSSQRMLHRRSQWQRPSYRLPTLSKSSSWRRLCLQILEWCFKTPFFF